MELCSASQVVVYYEVARLRSNHPYSSPVMVLLRGSEVGL